jgi:hypothetical protein
MLLGTVLPRITRVIDFTPLCVTLLLYVTLVQRLRNPGTERESLPSSRGNI